MHIHVCTCTVVNMKSLPKNYKQRYNVHVNCTRGLSYMYTVYMYMCSTVYCTISTLIHAYYMYTYLTRGFCARPWIYSQEVTERGLSSTTMCLASSDGVRGSGSEYALLEVDMLKGQSYAIRRCVLPIKRRWDIN